MKSTFVQPEIPDAPHVQTSQWEVWLTDPRGVPQLAIVLRPETCRLLQQDVDALVNHPENDWQEIHLMIRCRYGPEAEAVRQVVESS
jgi:hypothetical protein